MSGGDFIRRSVKRGVPTLLVITCVLYAMNLQRSSWPTWLMAVVGYVGVALFVIIWLVEARKWRAMATRYVEFSTLSGTPRGLFSWRRAIRAEAAERYGSKAARLTVRAVTRILLGQTLICVFGLAVFAEIAIVSAGGGTAGYFTGIVLVVGAVLMSAGVADGKAARNRAKELGIGPGAMMGVLMARDKYLQWCKGQRSESHPYRARN